eukprot:COSAG06_NODE_40019_length_406_cov_0.944625_1_plen_111_part_01
MLDIGATVRYQVYRSVYDCEVKLVANLVHTEAYWRLEPTDAWGRGCNLGVCTLGHGLDGRDAGYTASEMAWYKYAFTTLHPGGCSLGVAHVARRWYQPVAGRGTGRQGEVP